MLYERHCQIASIMSATTRTIHLYDRKDTHKILHTKYMPLQCLFLNVEDTFNPVVKVQGQIYHGVGSLQLAPNETPQFLQVYYVTDKYRQHRDKYMKH